MADVGDACVFAAFVLPAFEGPGAYKPVHAKAVVQALMLTVPMAQGLVVLPPDVLARLGTDRG